ncbi:MAG: type II toxin-antitoxin system RelE/ParE family toxin [Proteobacteria bacterium]|nr:type II toxin-antitoxin system RelE/ParE family toxin [Pseudomonadota bacterium]
MTLTVHVSRRAAREIERLAEWWSVHRPAAPGAVSADLAAALSILREQPGIGSRVVQAGSPDTRRFHLDRIGHWVYYRTKLDRLELLSVWYSGRKRMPEV